MNPEEIAYLRPLVETVPLRHTCRMGNIGHNKGPTMEAGAGWRRYAWRRARRELLPRMPIEVVRLRIRRARELGIDYKAYASIRSGTGRDIIALLFSSNALAIGPKLVKIPEASAAKLAQIQRCDRLALLHAPLEAESFLSENQGFKAAALAPTLLDSWGNIHNRIHQITTARGLPGPGVVVIGDTELEREWAEAGRLGGFLPSEAVFSL